MTPNSPFSNSSLYSTVTEDNELYGWKHTLAIDIVRSTKQVLQITDVSVVYGLFGNLGGALSLVVMMYGCLYAIESYCPHVVTHFELKGTGALQSLCSMCCQVCRCCAPRKLRAPDSFQPLQQQPSGPASGAIPPPMFFVAEPRQHAAFEIEQHHPVAAHV